MPLLSKTGGDREEIYVVDGVRLPSVTEVLLAVGCIEGHGDAWAMERGSRIHVACCHIDLGLEPDIEDEDLPYVEAYRRFLAETGAEPALIEQPVYHDVHRYVGTLDRLYVIGGGERWIADIKTGGLPRHTPIQLAAYAACLDRPVWKRCAVHLLPDGKYKLVHYRPETTPADFEVFLAALSVFKWRNQK